MRERPAQRTSHQPDLVDRSGRCVTNGRRREPRLPDGDGQSSSSLGIPHLLACFLGRGLLKPCCVFAERLLGGCSGVSPAVAGADPQTGVTSRP